MGKKLYRYLLENLTSSVFFFKVRKIQRALPRLLLEEAHLCEHPRKVSPACCVYMHVSSCMSVCVHVCAFQSQTSKENADAAAFGKGSPAIPVLRKKPEGRQGPGTCPDTVGYPQDWERGSGYF